MLYFVATPIGNLKEITYRAIEVLGGVDCIYAENPRHSLVLLNEYQIKKPVFEYQKWNEKAKVSEIISKLQAGQNIAIVSDAGMPLISDPGSVIVGELIASNCEYTVVSGACAMVNAVVLSGFDSSKFCMLGFLPKKNTAKKELLKKYKNLDCTLIFYVSIHDVDKDLDFLFSELGDRQVSVCREISKKFETVTRGRLGENLDITHKGEIVVVVAPCENVIEEHNMTIKEHILAVMESGNSKKDAIKIVSAERKIAKAIVYKKSIDI